jgi:hypothetical protein
MPPTCGSTCPPPSPRSPARFRRPSSVSRAALPARGHAAGAAGLAATVPAGAGPRRVDRRHRGGELRAQHPHLLVCADLRRSGLRGRRRADRPIPRRGRAAACRPSRLPGDQYLLRNGTQGSADLALRDGELAARRASRTRRR